MDADKGKQAVFEEMRMSDCCCSPAEEPEASCCCEPREDSTANEGCCGGDLPEGGDCCCSGPSVEITRTITVEFCYLDVVTCERCQGADVQVDKAVAAVEGALALCGCAIEVRRVLVDDERMAERYRLVSSPTIRVDGVDICDTVEENPCIDCGDIANDDITCRVFEYRGKKYDTPPVPLIIDTILRVYLENLSHDISQDPYELPENLARFYAGKRAQASAAQGGGAAPKQC